MKRPFLLFLLPIIFPVLFFACAKEKTSQMDEPDPVETTEVNALPEVPAEELAPDYSPVELAGIHDFLLLDFVPGELTEYEEKPMGEDDFRVVIPGAKEVFVGKYKKKSPITNAYGSGIRPRITVQTFEFEEGADAEAGMVQWIRSMEGGADFVNLGDPVRALKSPPFMVMVEGQAVSVVSTACEHTGEEWDRLREVFFSWTTLMEKHSSGWAFGLECGGPLEYKLKKEG